MIIRRFAWTLLASTALTSIAFAQTPPATNAPANTSSPAPAQAHTQAQPDFGTVYATQPSVALAQHGLTASPTDYGAILQKAAAQTGQAHDAPFPVTPGGVTGADIGGGYMINEEAVKTRSTVTRDAIDKLAPTANPYQMINLLPGVVASSVDNSGLNGGNIKLRGFNSDHLGLTIEGMPVNDSGNYALYPQEYVDAENISQISIAQGTPDLDSPHIGAVGGVINILMRDPSKTAGALADFSVGSDNLYREFLRVELGEIDHVRAYVSYSNLTKDHWAEPGKDERQHVDFKVVWDLSEGNTIRFSAIYNHAVNDFYANPKMSDFLNPSYKPAYSATGAGTNSNFYQYKVNPFDNLILSAPSNFTISKDLKFDTIPYFWYGFGNGGGVTTMSNSGMYWGDLKVTNVNWGGSLYYNPSITETYRPGIIDKLTYDAGNHEIVAGHWFEYAVHRQTGPFEALNPDGTVPDVFANTGQFSLPATAVCQPYNPVTKTVGAAVTCPARAMEKRDQLTSTMTNALFIGDTWKTTDRLTLIYGVKQVFVNRQVDDYMPGSSPELMSLFDTATLPTVGARYKLDRDNTVFANFATSFRSAPNYTLVQSFSATNGVVTPAGIIPPEEGKTVEVGHRYQGANFSTSISGFAGYYQNYQVSSYATDPAGSSSTVQVTYDVGDVINYGVDAEIGTRRFYDFRGYASGELLHTEMLDNAITSQAKTSGGSYVNDYLVTKGKQLPGAPNYQFGVGIDYDNGHLFSNIAYKYLGPQYSTFVNDEQMKAFGRVDASVGYRFDDLWGMKKPEIKLSLFNILNARELTGVYGIQNNAQSTTGVNGNKISGFAPTYYMGEPISFMLTFRVGM